MAGTTSLLRSAASARKKIQAQQDAEVAYGYSNSAKTYDDYKWYDDYLSKRALSAPDASTALTLQKARDGAYKGYISNEVQRASNNIITGQGTSTDKYNKILNFYNEAVDKGMYDLAQDLDYKLGNLQVSMQGEYQRQQDAGMRMAEAQSKAYEKEVKAQGYANRDMAQDLETAMKELSNAWSKGGQKAYNDAAKKWIEGDSKAGIPSVRALLKGLNGGEDVLPKNATTSIGQVLTGVADAIGTYYQLAADATIDMPEESQKYLDKLEQYRSGELKFNTPMGKVTFDDLKAIENDPRAFVPKMVSTASGTKYEATLSTKFGYEVDAKGNVVPVFSGSASEGTNRKQFDKTLQKLGFDINKDSYQDKDGYYRVTLNEKTNKWLDPALIGGVAKGEPLLLEPSATGFQLRRPDGSLYNIATDKKGLGGVFKIDANGSKHVSGQYGFDQTTNSLTTNISQVLGKSQKYLQGQQKLKNAANEKIQSWVNPTGAMPTQDAALNFARQAMNAVSKPNGMPKMVRRADGGFNFTDARGNAVSAYTYAKLANTSFRNVLSNMAKQGDSFAANALRYAGDDGGYDASKVDVNTAKKWSSLTWGNQIKLGVPQAARVAKVSGPWGGSGVIPGTGLSKMLGL